MTLRVNGADSSSGVAESTLTTRGDIFVRDASAVTRLALGSAGKVLRSDGTDLVYTTLTIPTTAARGTVLVASATNVVSAIALGSAGKILRSDGTDLVYTTATFPTTAARGTLLVATATDTVTALAANAADTFVGGDGTDVTTRTAAQVRASLGAYTAIDGASSGWTYTAGSGTGASASAAGTVLRLGLNGVIADDASGGFLGPRATRVLAGGLTRWSVIAKLTAASNIDSNSRINFSVRVGAAQTLTATVRDSGAMEILKDSATPVVTVASAVALGGNDWLRLDREGGQLLVYGCTLAGLTQPAATDWRLLYVTPLAVGTATLLHTTITLSLAQYSAGPPGAVVVDWSQLYVRDEP